MSRRALLLAALAGTACGLTSLESDPVPELLSERLSVQVINGSRGPALLFRALDKEGSPTPVARLDGVRIALAESDRVSERLLPFASVQSELSALSLECEPFSDHTIRIRVILAAEEDHLHIRVEDEVGLLSQIQGLTLDYHFLAEGPVDESFVPHLQPDSDQVVGDVAFGTPLGYLRSGTRALALVPDVDLLNRERRLPQAMEMDMEPSPTLRHGLVSYRTLGTGSESDPVLFTGQGAEPVVVQGESLHFAHELYLLANASHRSIGEVSAAMLLRRTAGGLEDAATPFDRLSEAAFEHEVADGWASVDLGGVVAGTFRSAAADQVGLTDSVAWFTTLRQNLRTAYGLELLATRTGQPELREKVVQMVDLLLAAPHRGGMYPGLVGLDAEAEQTPWRPTAAYRGALPDHFRALDTAWTAYWLLRLAERIPERREAILAVCAETARFLMSNQLESGAIPAYYDPSYLAPRSEPLYENGLESAGIGLFLAQYGAATGDGSALWASRRALEPLISTRGSQNAGDAETLVAAGPLHTAGDPRSRQWPRGSLSLMFAAHAALTLSAHGDYPEALELAEVLLDQLGLFQQQWSPTWMDPGLTGGLGSSNLDLSWSTGRESMAAHVWLLGYLATGRADFLRRGALALRAGLAMPAGDLNWGRGAAITTAEIGRASLGQGVVDVAGGFAQGLDALWFEGLEVSGTDVSFRLLTREDFDAGARIVFANLGDQESLSIVANGEPLGVFGAAELARGITVPVRRVARLYFRPPGAIHHLAPWYPRARFEGDLTQEGRSVVEIHTGGALLTELEMGPGDTPGTLVAREPFIPAGLGLGEVINARLVVVQGGRPEAEPATGFREIVLEELHTLDAGDDDEANLVDVGSSIVERFADGRENSRSVSPGGDSFTYWIPVEPETERLTLSVYLSGGARLSCEQNLLHEVPDSAAPIRELLLTLSDRRLWREGGINLTFAATGQDRLQVARIRYLATGRVDLPTEVGPRQTQQVREQTLRVLVVPVDLPDRTLDAGEEALRQAFFGGPEYGVTPAPESRRTAGSAAELVAAMSGGLTSLEGEVAETVPLALIATDLQGRADGGRAQIAQALDEVLQAAFDAGHDVVAVVHGRGPEPMIMDAGTIAGSATLPAVVFLSDRDQSGSFLPVGRLLGAVLEARFGFLRMDAPAAGNFGELALTASGSHIPSGPAGVNLLRSGWVDRVVVTEREQPLVRLPNLQEDRAFYVLPGLGASGDDELLPGRGNLIVEDRHGGPGEPGLPAQGGALIYWDFPDHRPLLIGSEGQSASPRFLRLSPRRSILETPFIPGSADPIEGDLFTEPVSLGADTRPSLVAPQGELIWSLNNLRPTSEGRRSVTLRYHPMDLLQVREVGWRTRVGSDPPSPLPVNASRVDLGSVSLDQSGLELTTRSEANGSIAGVFPLFERTDRQGSAAIDELLAQLEPDRERAVRLRAVRSLENLAVEASVPTLLQFTRDADPRVAAAARESADAITARVAEREMLPSMRPHRLLGRIAWMRGGAAELRVGVGDQQYFRAALHSGDEPSHLEVDLPAFASGDIGRALARSDSPRRPADFAPDHAARGGTQGPRLARDPAFRRPGHSLDGRGLPQRSPGNACTGIRKYGGHHAGDSPRRPGHAADPRRPRVRRTRGSIGLRQRSLAQSRWNLGQRPGREPTDPARRGISALLDRSDLHPPGQTPGRVVPRSRRQGRSGQHPARSGIGDRQDLSHARSVLPPLKIAPTRLPRSSSPILRRAARTVAPDGSTRIFIR